MESGTGLYFNMTDCSHFLSFSFLSPFKVFLQGSHSFIFLRIYPLHSFIHSIIQSFILSLLIQLTTFSHSSGKMSLILIVLLQLSLFFRNVISACSTSSDLEFTFYGYPDGPSDTTSFGCSGTTKVEDGTAGGSSPVHPPKLSLYHS